jgi:hypothetical protein
MPAVGEASASIDFCPSGRGFTTTIGRATLRINRAHERADHEQARAPFIGP